MTRDIDEPDDPRGFRITGSPIPRRFAVWIPRWTGGHEFPEKYAMSMLSNLCLLFLLAATPSIFCWKISAQSTVAAHDEDASSRHYQAGLNFYQARKLKAAEAEFRKAIRINPKCSQCHFELGKTLLGESRGLEAIAEIQQAASLDPHNMPVHSELATLLLHDKRCSEAEAEYEHIVQLASDEKDKVGGLYGLVLAFDCQQRYMEASVLSRQGIQLYPEFSGFYSYLGDYLLNKEKKYTEAEETARRGINRFPDDFILYNILGYAIGYQNRWVEAEPVFRKQVELAPGFANPHDSLGDDLYEQGRYAEAESEYRKAIQLEPNTAIFQEHLKNVLKARQEQQRETPKSNP